MHSGSIILPNGGCPIEVEAYCSIDVRCGSSSSTSSGGNTENWPKAEDVAWENDSANSEMGEQPITLQDVLLHLTQCSILGQTLDFAEPNAIICKVFQQMLEQRM